VVEPGNIVWHQFRKEVGVIRRGRQMYDALDSLHGTTQRRPVAKVAENEIGGLGHRNAIKSPDPVSTAMELSNHCSPNSSG
jgi:hypothetical protein